MPARFIPTLTPEQRLRQPILAAALDCLRPLVPGEPVIDLRPGAYQTPEKKRPRRSSHSRRANDNHQTPRA